MPVTLTFPPIGLRLTCRYSVGEMALLDQEPRSASVTSTEETTLLEINGEDFYDLMASRMEIMQGIVKILTQRLREAKA